MGLNYNLIDPTSKVNPTEPTLRSVPSGGHSLWSADEGVHLAWEAYRDLAAAIAEMAESGDADDNLSYSSERSKRKHPDSVVTLPRSPHPKRLATWSGWEWSALWASVQGEVGMESHHCTDAPKRRMARRMAWWRQPEGSWLRWTRWLFMVKKKKCFVFCVFFYLPTDG
jgi:hypothetical protein